MADGRPEKISTAARWPKNLLQTATTSASIRMFSFRSPEFVEDVKRRLRWRTICRYRLLTGPVRIPGESAAGYGAGAATLVCTLSSSSGCLRRQSSYQVDLSRNKGAAVKDRRVHARCARVSLRVVRGSHDPAHNVRRARIFASARDIRAHTVRWAGGPQFFYESPQSVGVRCTSLDQGTSHIANPPLAPP
jgi:hypothetical protein